MLNKILRRPLVTSGAALATLAATAAGYASTNGHHTAPASYTASPEAVAQAAEQSTTQTDNNAYLASAKNAANQQRAAAAAKATAQAQARVAAESAARKAAAERAAREQQRQQILAQARSNPRAVARLMLQQYGWSGQFGCLDSLWTKESNWNFRATNGSSGAYGIPQALPGSKMAGIAADWRTNPVTQIKWGLQYIRSTYGTPCSAWAHSQATNWY